MFVQNMETVEQLVAIPVEEYSELIKCQTQLNAVYGLLTLCHTDSLRATGKKSQEIDTDILEVISGYEENENLFNCLADEFKRRRARR